jgi:hypothetical protein
MVFVVITYLVDLGGELPLISLIAFLLIVIFRHYVAALGVGWCPFLDSTDSVSDIE